MSTPTRTAACVQLAVYFLARPGQRIPAIDLVPMGGLLSWRTRVSDLRKPPYNLDIRNETETAYRSDGSRYTASFYTFVSAQVREIAS